MVTKKFFKKQDEKDIDNVAEGYCRAVSDVISNERFGIKEASSLLRGIMAESHDVKNFLKQHPEASIERAMAYSYSEKSKHPTDQSWLRRITKGTVASLIIFYFICHFWYKFQLFLA